MPRGTGRVRRVVAALLALALLVLPVAPMRHASAAPTASRQDAAQLCVTRDGMAQGQALVPHHRHGQPGEHPGDTHGLAWCASAPCPAMLAVPPVAPGQPSAPSSLRRTGIAVPAAPEGIAVDPALHPPRPPA